MTAAKGKAAETYCTIVLQTESHVLFNQMYYWDILVYPSLPVVVVSLRISLFLTLITMSSEGFPDGDINSEAT